MPINVEKKKKSGRITQISKLKGLKAKKTKAKNVKVDFAGALGDLAFADLCRTPRTIATSGNVRIDVQGDWTENNTRKGTNIQAQFGKETIAAVRVADESLQALGQQNQTVVLDKVKYALKHSEADQHWYNVTGTAP